MNSLQRFLANQPAAMRREVVMRMRPDLLTQMNAYGTEWRVLCAERGIACPDELAALGDAMADLFPYFKIARHSYAMLTPTEARDEIAFLADMATSFPVLEPYTAMLPVFGQDGDLLLLARDGRVYALAHDDWEGASVAASSLSELFDHATAAALNPAG